MPAVQAHREIVRPLLERVLSHGSQGHAVLLYQLEHREESRDELAARVRRQQYRRIKRIAVPHEIAYDAEYLSAYRNYRRSEYPFERLLGAHPVQAVNLRLVERRHQSEHRPFQTLRILILEPAAVRLHLEIGRASCRERV